MSSQNPTMYQFQTHNPNKIYQKDYRIIEQMLYQFKLAFQHKTLSLQEFNAYHKNMHDLQLLINSFLKNTFDILTKKQIMSTLRNIEFLVYDQAEKIKEILQMYQQSQQKRLAKSTLHTQRVTTTCQRCYQNVRKVNIQQTKDYLQNEYMGTLDRMILDAKMQINGQLFTEEEDQLFFKQLHNTLKKKHQNIEFNSKSIQSLISKITKQISQLNLMKKMAIQQSQQLQSPNYIWMKNIQTSMNQLLQSTFKKKVPVFLESMIGLFESHFIQKNKKQTINEGIQTLDYESIEINEYKQKIIKLNSAKFKLQNDMKWLEQQIQIKNNQITEQGKRYKQDIQNHWNQLISQKQRNKRMQFTIDTLNKQISIVKQDINKKTQKQQWFKKKISKVEKQKLEIQIQNIRSTAQKDYLSETNDKFINEKRDLSSQQQLERQKFKQGQNSKIKSKKLISKLTIKESKSKTKNQNQPQLLKHIDMLEQNNPIDTKINQNQIFSQSSQCSHMQLVLQQNDSNLQQDQNQEIDGQNDIEEQDQCDQNQSNDDEKSNNHSNYKVQNQQSDNKHNQMNNFQYKDGNQIQALHEQIMSNDTPNQYNLQVKRINELMEQRLKQSGILFLKRNSKKSQVFTKTYSKISTQNNNQKQKNQDNTNSDHSFKSTKKLHFRSQTLLNNFKMKTSEGCETQNHKYKNTNYQGYQNKSKQMISTRNIQQNQIGSNGSNFHNSHHSLKKSKRVKINYQDLNNDINELMTKIHSKLNQDVKQNNGDNKNNQFKDLILQIFSKYGIKASYTQDFDFNKEYQHNTGSSKTTQKNMTNFQRKANKSVSFFKQNQINLISHPDDENNCKINKKSKNNQENKQKIAFVEKTFPIVYKSCFNTPNMMNSQIKNANSKLSSDASKKLIWKSLPDQGIIQNKQSLLKPNKTKEQTKKLKQIKNITHKRSQSNQIQRQNIKRKTIKVDIFTKQDFDLFIDQMTAYLYQCNHMKSHPKYTKSSINQQNQGFIKNIFQDIGQIKQLNIYFYEEIVSFIRYPYQTVKNINWGACITKGLKYQSFLKFMQRIVHLHRKCHVSNETGCCSHLMMFNKKIQTVKNQAIRLSHA